MKVTLPSQFRVFEGTQMQARTFVRELLANGQHPAMIVKEAIIPAVEASGQALGDGSLRVGELPELEISLQGVMEELEESLQKAGVTLHFRIGRARDDVFDLWGTEIAGAFEAAGFTTSRSSELNRCEGIRVCELASAGIERDCGPRKARATDWLRATKRQAIALEEITI
jgi:hypothetical protein